MTIERARQLRGFEGMTDAEVLQQISKDKNAMRETLKLIMKQSLAIDTENKN